MAKPVQLIAWRLHTAKWTSICVMTGIHLKHSGLSICSIVQSSHIYTLHFHSNFNLSNNCCSAYLVGGEQPKKHVINIWIFHLVLFGSSIYRFLPGLVIKNNNQWWFTIQTHQTFVSRQTISNAFIPSVNPSTSRCEFQSEFVQLLSLIGERINIIKVIM